MKRLGGATGLLLLAIAVGAVAIGAWQVGLLVVATVALMSTFQVVGRRAAGRRQEPHDQHGQATARGRIDTGAQQLLGRSRWTGWLYEDVPADVTTGPDGLTFTPRRLTARFGGFQERTVPWRDVVDVTEQDLGRENRYGKVSFTRLSLLRFRLTGDLVPWTLRPDWQEVAEQKAAEERPLDGSTQADAADWGATLRRLELEDDGELGCLVLTFATDHPGPLVEVVNRWAAGKPLVDEPGQAMG